MQISSATALGQLKQSNQLFATLFQHVSLSVEVYKPIEKDLQQPHAKDKVYIIISGSGEFINGDTKTNFQSGDLLFVPAFTPHQFVNFTNNFATWVIYYGPKGGETSKLV
jgi:mannose-6-phosphate isomerase-like protein (cupin superfamily)